jgi:hypothetical protein
MMKRKQSEGSVGYKITAKDWVVTWNRISTKDSGKGTKLWIASYCFDGFNGYKIAHSHGGSLRNDSERKCMKELVASMMKLLALTCSNCKRNQTEFKTTEPKTGCFGVTRNGTREGTPSIAQFYFACHVHAHNGVPHEWLW